MFKIERASLRNRDAHMIALGKSMFKHYRNISSLVSDTQEIGSGGNGSVLTGMVKFMDEKVPIKSIIAIKTSKSEEPYDEYDEYDDDSIGDSIHYEFQIMKKVNTILHLVPNFPTCLMYLKCDTEDPYQKLCDSTGKPRDYILQEKVDGVMIHEFVEKTQSEHMWLSILLQILVALQVAQDYIEFAHYDLHSSNFLIRQIESPYNVIMQAELKSGEKINIPTFNFIPVIIDFGRAHVYFETQPDYAENRTTFQRHFTYNDGTQGVQSTKFSAVYDPVEITRNMFDKSPAEFDADMQVISNIVNKEYGGFYDKKSYSLPQNETGPYKKPLDFIKALMTTKLATEMCEEASMSNPKVFSWKNKEFLSDPIEYGILGKANDTSRKAVDDTSRKANDTSRDTSRKANDTSRDTNRKAIDNQRNR